MANEVNNAPLAGDFYISIDNIRDVSNRYYGAMQAGLDEARRAQAPIKALSGMNYVGSYMGSARSMTDTLISRIGRHMDNVSLLADIANAYEMAENNLLGLPTAEVPIMPLDPIPLPEHDEPSPYNPHYPEHQDDPEHPTDPDDPTQKESEESGENDGELEQGVAESKTSSSQGVKGGETTVYNNQYKSKENNKWNTTAYGKEYKQQGVTTKRVGSIVEYGGSIGAQATLWNATRSKEYEYGSYSAEIYALRAEAYASYGVGAMVFKNKEGKYIAGVGAHAEAGATVTITGGSAKGDIGTAAIGAKAGVSYAIGQITTQGGAVIGFANGPVAYVEGSAGAYAASVTGSVAGRLMGIEVGVKGTLMVGVGAYANFGLEGGKFVLGFGVALGIGFKVNLTLDFSKVGDAIKSAGKTIANAAKKAAEAVANAAKKAAEAVANAAKKAANAVKNFFSSW